MGIMYSVQVVIPILNQYLAALDCMHVTKGFKKPNTKVKMAKGIQGIFSTLVCSIDIYVISRQSRKTIELFKFNYKWNTIPNNHQSTD
jgi:hypothetical protein